MASIPVTSTTETERAHGTHSVAGSLAFGVAVIALMQTMSIPLLPVMAEAFDTSIAAVSWVATVTLIVGAAANPIIGRMGDMYGKRRLLLGCLGVAIGGCVVAATAQSLPVVVAGRALQGIGSGVIPLSYGIIRDRLSSRHVGRGIALVTAAGAGLGAGLGPVLVGAVVGSHGWRSAFWLTGALLLIAFGLVGVMTRGPVRRFPARFDVPGAVVLGAALTVLLLGITNASRWGWASGPVVVLVGASVVMMAWWVRWERCREEPMVDLVVNRRRSVLSAHFGGVMVGCATFAQYIASFTLVTLPRATGYGLGQSLTVAGLVQLPGAIALTVAVAATTRASGRHSPSSMLRLSAAILVAGFGLMIVRHASVFDVAAAVTVVSVGLGIGHCAGPIMILRHVVIAQTAAVNAVNALARVVGSVLAAAIVTTVMATGSTLVAGVVRPDEWTFVFACLVGALPAVGVGLLCRRAGPDGQSR